MNIIQFTEADPASTTPEKGEIWIDNSDNFSAYILHESPSGRWVLVSLETGDGYLPPARSAIGAFGDDFADFEKAKIGAIISLIVD